MADHYQTLGISEQAAQAEIKAAFKKLAVQFHPDKHGGHPEMEERFKEINEAYQVLSNPYEKARYDLARQFGSTSYTSYTPPPPQYHHPHSHRPRRPYVDPRINWRENWIATAYAFGFTFIMAVIVMSGISIKKYFDEKKLEECLALRRSVFEQVQKNYEVGKVEAALTSLNDLGVFTDKEKDMKEFKERVYVEFLDRAERSYKKAQYEDAIYYFELIQNYGPRTTYVLQEHLADSYKSAGKIEEAIAQYNELLVSNFNLLNSYMSLAHIYHINLQNPTEALVYYEKANEHAIKLYKSMYGNAYPLVLTASVIPKEHYFLYTGMARAYLESGNPERAIKATKWNLNIWPQSAENYITAAEGFEQIGNHRRACRTLRTARELGYLGEVSFECN